MRIFESPRGAIQALLAAVLSAAVTVDAMAQDRCLTWSEARSAGLIEKFKLRSAPEIKADVEKRHGGKVVSFQICQESGELIYKLAVFRADGKVQYVTEPAEPATSEAISPDMPEAEGGK